MIELGESVPDMAPVPMPSAQHPTPVSRRIGAFPKRSRNVATVAGLVDFRFGNWVLGDEAAPDAMAASPFDLEQSSDAALRPTPTALAELIVARLRDYQTLDSQCAAMNEAGIAATRLLLANWMHRAAERLAPLAEAIARHGRRAPMLAVANKSFGQRYGPDRRLWLYRANGPAVASGVTPALLWLRVTPDRLGGYAAQELETFDGVLQAMPMSGYDRIARRTGHALIGCWDIIRARAAELDRRAVHPLLGRFLDLSFKLRSIEGQIGSASPEAVAVLRNRDARPLIEDFERSLARWRFAIEPYSPVGEFARDLWALWPSLTAFLDDGGISLENKASKRIEEMLSADNRWVFGRHQDSRNSAAILYTLMESCVLNGVDPRSYLARMLTGLEDEKNLEEADLPMPWRFSEGSAVPRRSISE